MIKDASAGFIPLFISAGATDDSRSYGRRNPGYCDYSMNFRDPVPEGKPFAVAYRTWINYLGALARAGWLTNFDYQTPSLG